MGLGVGSVATGKFYNSYPHVILETVFPALKFTQNCYLNYKSFFLKTGNLIVIWLPLLRTGRTKRLSSPCDKIWKQGEFRNPNFQILKLFVELEKTLKCSQNYSKIPIFRRFHEILEKLGSIKSARPTKSKFWICGWIRKSYVLI